MDLSSLIAKSHVSPEEAAVLKVGNDANLFPPDGGKVSGKVTQISSALDAANTTVEVWVQVANPAMKLRAGTSLRMEIIAKSEPVALVIPQSAVVTSASGATSVMIVGEGDKPKKQPVTLGIHSDGNVQVTEGVKSGDRVVTTGVYELSKLDSDVLEKTKLQIQPAKEPPDPDEEDEK
jgi:cobalt-zinc-cadmium efflux system membrane fusion protein